MNPEMILVDDDKILLIILEKMLRIVKPGCRLTSFSSGRDALNHLSVIPNEDKAGAVLLDINLKDMSAWEFMNELTDENVPKIILMTSSVSSLNSEKAKKYPRVIGLFEKPITIEIIHQIFELIEAE